MSKKVYLIVGSTRPNRIGKQIADWVAERARQNKDIDLEVVDLQELDLPLFAKPYSPSYVEEVDDDVKPWGDMVKRGEGFIFVTAEYNRGVPAPLKSAFDHLGKQHWGGKPAAIVSYGYLDGGQSATRHFRDSLGWFEMPVMEPAVALKLEHGDVDNGKFVDINKTLSPHAADIDAAVDALAKA